MARARTFQVVVNMNDSEANNDKDKLKEQHENIRRGINCLNDNDDNVNFVKGQLEKSEGGVIHYQLLVRFCNPKTINAAKTYLATALKHQATYIHLEICTDLEASLKYVQKANNGFNSWAAEDGEDDEDSTLQWCVGKDIDAGLDKRKKNAVARKLLDCIERSQEGESLEDRRQRFLDLVKDEMPTKYIFDRGAVNRATNLYFPTPSEGVRYSPTSFLLPLLELPPKGHPRPWAYLFVGKSGTGKTKFALAHFKKPLLVSNKEDYNKLCDGTYDGIVVDDMPFNKHHAQNLIHMLDVAEDRTVNVKYGSARIPAFMPRIFTINDEERFYPENCLENEREALNRRLRVVHVNFHLYKNNDCDIGGCLCKQGDAKKAFSIFVNDEWIAKEKKRKLPTREEAIAKQKKLNNRMVEPQPIKRVELTTISTTTAATTTTTTEAMKPSTSSALDLLAIEAGEKPLLQKKPTKMADDGYLSFPNDPELTSLVNSIFGTPVKTASSAKKQ